MNRLLARKDGSQMYVYDRVNVGSMVRSGIVLCYNILKDIRERNANLPQCQWVLTRDEFTLDTSPNALNIHLVRDIRDILRSYCIKEGVDLINLNIYGKNYMLLTDMLIGHDFLLRLISWAQRIILPYANNMHERLISYFFNFWDLGENDDMLYYMRKYHFEAVKSRLPPKELYKDEETGFYWNHLSDGKMQKWKEFSPKEIILLNNFAKLNVWLTFFQNTYRESLADVLSPKDYL